MKKFLRRAATLVLALVVLAVSPVAAKALMIAPQPAGFRALNAPVVIIGTVTSIEKNTITSKKDGNEYIVAIVKVEQGIKGIKDVTHVRVAWIAPKPVVNPNPNPNPGGPILIRPGFRRPLSMVLAKDQGYLLFLQKNETDGFFIGSGYPAAVVKEGNANFKAEVADVERTLKVAADPLTALKGTDKEARLLAVAVQLDKYRTQRTANAKQEPIDAEESKLILKTLADTDWAQNPATPRLPGAFRTNPQNLFNRLGLTPADGWMQPKVYQETPAAAKKWLTDNAGKYVIKRFVEQK